MIMIDSSALVGSLCGSRASEDRLIAFMAAGERFLLSTITLYEWFRGPRSEDEIFWRELLFPDDEAVTFGPIEAAIAADIYRMVKSPRRRQVDIAIAATAISRDVPLWTLNTRDFDDIPGLRLL
jgi:predicted nucleic acid-binding protein